MKKRYLVPFFGMALFLAGCATSTQVQEMIDASHRNYLDQLDAHDESISVLKKSAVAGLEKSSDNAERLDELEKQVEGLARQMVVVQDLANASKVMSAANTVRVADLDERLVAHQEDNDKVLARMGDIDKLYEEVLIRQFQQIADSANAAMASIKENGVSASTNAPVMIDEPIQVLAPDTTAPTNGSEPDADTNSAAIE